MTQTLRELLIDPPPDGGEPLFESAAVLAAQISRDKTHRFRSPQTVATLLSNLMRGHRPCSKELEAAILSAVQKRLANAPPRQKEAVLKSVEVGIENANKAFRSRSTSKSIALRSSTSPENDLAAIQVPKEVPELFRRIGESKGLVCVDYRDYPKAGPEGEYEKMAKDVGEAVASGACFAMFQPFGEAYKPEGKYFHTLAVRNYLENLAQLLKSTYLYILGFAIDAAKTKAAQTQGGKVESAIDVSKRIMLYQRGIPANESCRAFLASGIQSRLFYAEFPTLGEEKAEQEVWEWVSTSDETDDVFIKRSDDSIPKQVVRDQFFPVVRYWKKHKNHLPTDAEIRAAIKLCNEDERAQLPENFWTVFLTPEKAVERVEALGKL